MRVCQSLAQTDQQINPKVQQALGDLANIKHEVAAPIVPAIPIQPVPPVPSALAGTPDIAAILASIAASQPNNLAAPVPVPAPAPAPPLPGVDPQLAEFLKTMQPGFFPPFGAPMPPFPFPPQPQQQQQQQQYQRPGSSGSQPLRDVRPWVTINTGGKYRDPCRFIGLGKCEKGDSCPYIHPQ